MTDERAKRKLSGILSADAVGYSRLMQDDEASTIRNLEDSKLLMSELIEQFKGRVVDAPGDNLLAEFGSVVDATECAVNIQKELKTKNEELPDNRKMQFRIGVNLGDVVEEADRIYGDGVNIAARIEGLAKPGGICISRTAYDQVKNKLYLGYEYLGDHSVKNIAEPVRVYRVLTELEAAGKVIGEKRFLGRISRRAAISAIVVLVIVAGGLIGWNIYLQQPKKMEPASIEKMAFPLPNKPSIAVLPFDNLSGDPTKEYFCDGLSEEIITALTKVPNLFVIARNSSFTYKGQPVKVQQVSEELGVQYVVEGSVRWAGDGVRIIAQLIDALTGHHMWAEKYDRDVKEIFAVQDEITKEIITALQIQLTEGEQAEVYSRGTNNLKAYLKVIEASWLYYQATKEGVLKARQLSEEAIALDPDYAFAYKTLGGTHGLAIQLGLSKNPRESLKFAIGMFRKAIELDDSLAIAHIALGFFSLYARQYEIAAAEAKRALELQPNSADVINGYAVITSFLGRPKEAIPFFNQALRLNPKPPSSYLHFIAMAFRDSGQYEMAIVQAKRATEKEPNNLIANVVLTSSYSLAGRDEQARAAAKKILKIAPKFSVARWQKRSAFKNKTTVKRYCDALRKAGLPD
jgi:adenylate cyclase